MAASYLPYEPQQQRLLPDALQDWLPEGHLAYFISDSVDSLDLSAFHARYAKGGPRNQPFHPAMMIKVLIYGYATGTFSSRKLAAKLHEDVALRVLAAENYPAHRTLSDFRALHLQELSALFVQVVRLARECGLVKLGTVAVDGTKLKANASRHKAMSYERMLKAEAELKAQIDGLLNRAKAADDLEKNEPDIDIPSEIKRQIPVLQEWVVSKNLLTLDRNKPLEVRTTPAYQAGVAGASIEAPGPYRPQDRTYYNVTPLDGETPEQAESSLREYNHWILQILNIHEAIPGHYAQLVYANKSPSIVKSIFGNGAMVEGWAVYGERMMLESGYGNNAPEMWLMYSKWNLRSVTNTILDYSVHVLGMTEAQALDLLTRQAFQTKREATEKWRRVQLSSVQLTSYFSGYSEIMDLREQRKQALGNKFVLKDFHEQFLSYGSAPVKVIKELMN